MTIVRVIDFETTGEEPPEAEVCEVGYCDVDVEARRVLPPVSWLCRVAEMPPASRAVHHISLSDCQPCGPFDPARMFGEGVAVYAAHNADFEAQFVTCPRPLICTYKAALRVWPQAPTHSNGGLRYWLEDQGLVAPEHALTLPAHRAGPDAYVTAHLLLALLNAGATGREMAAWTREPALLPRCPIGEHRGKPWSEVDFGFLDWMVRKPEMDIDLKWNAWREINRRRAAASQPAPQPSERDLT